MPYFRSWLTSKDTDSLRMLLDEDDLELLQMFNVHSNPIDTLKVDNSKVVTYSRCC